MGVQCVAVAKESLRDALTDDDDRFRAAAVSVGELAAGDERDAEHLEEAMRYEADVRAWGFFAIGRRISFDAEGLVDAGPARLAGITPRDEAADGDSVDPGQLANPPGGLVRDGEHLRAVVETRRRQRHVDRKHVAHIVASASALQRD